MLTVVLQLLCVHRGLETEGPLFIYDTQGLCCLERVRDTPPTGHSTCGVTDQLVFSFSFPGSLAHGQDNPVITSVYQFCHLSWQRSLCIPNFVVLFYFKN